jgi:hypothetical protein
MTKSKKSASGRKPLIKASKKNKAVKGNNTNVPRVSPDAGIHDPPHGYNIDTIVLMQVNTDTSFIYWEITDTLLNGNRKKLETGKAQLMVKVFEADCLKEVCSFEVQDRVGSSYINYGASFKPLTAEIGISNGKGYVGLLKTRTDASPSFIPSGAGKVQVSSPGERPSFENRQAEEIWMTNRPEEAGITRVPFSDSCDVMEKIIDYYSSVSDSHETSFFNRTK